MIVSVMRPGQQCSSNARITPKTTGALTKSAVSKELSPIEAPDWTLVGILLASPVAFLVAGLASIKIYNSVSKNKKQSISPQYRTQATEADWSKLASKEVHVTREPVSNSLSVKASVDSFSSDFWDFEQQSEIENYSAPEVYKQIQTQTDRLSSLCADQTKGIRDAFDALTSQTDQLKSILNTKMDSITRHTDALLGLDDTDKRMGHLQNEIARRKKLAEDYGVVLHTAQDMITSEMELREKHDRSEMSLIQSAEEFLSDFSLQFESANDKVDDFDRLFVSLDSLEKLVSNLSSERETECKRRCVWPSINQPFGCVLVDPATGADVPASELFGPSGRLKEVPGLIEKHKQTGLYFPSAKAMMRLPSGDIQPVPIGTICIHPLTGRAIPIEGSVCVDLGTGRLVYTHSPEPHLPVGSVVPLLINVINPSTGRMVDTPFKKYANKFPFPQSIIDPSSGQLVPILGVALDPLTGGLIPVGGTMIDPVTKLRRPIAFGAMFQDPQTGSALPVASVSLDVFTGRAEPGGGIVFDPRHKKMFPICLGVHFVEGLSGLEASLYGACRDPVSGSITGMYGGDILLYDNHEMNSSLECVHTLNVWCTNLKQITSDCNSICAELHAQLEIDTSKRLVSNAKVIQDLRTRLSSRKREFSSTMHKFERELKECRQKLDIARRKNKERYSKWQNEVHTHVLQNKRLFDTGGVEGFTRDHRTNAEIPILIGELHRERNSGLMCPILGIHADKELDKIIPLSGTMSDPLTGETIPITQGSRMRDMESGRLVLVTGAKLDVATGRVVPISDQSQAFKAELQEQIAELEKELASRNSFDRRFRSIADEIAKSHVNVQNALVRASNSCAEEDARNLIALQRRHKELQDQMQELYHHEFGQRRQDHSYKSLKEDTTSLLLQKDAALKSDCEMIVKTTSKFCDLSGDFSKRIQAWILSYNSRLQALTEARDQVGLQKLQAEAQKIREGLLSELSSALSKDFVPINSLLIAYAMNSEGAQVDARVCKTQLQSRLNSLAEATKGQKTVRSAEIPQELRTLVQELVDMLSGQPTTVFIQTSTETVLEQGSIPIEKPKQDLRMASKIARDAALLAASDEAGVGAVSSSGVEISPMALAAIEEQLQQEEELERQAVARQVEEDKMNMLEAKKKEILERNKALDKGADEQQEILAQNKEELQQLEQALDMEKVRQEDSINERLTATRSRRKKEKIQKLEESAEAVKAQLNDALKKTRFDPTSKTGKGGAPGQDGASPSDQKDEIVRLEDMKKLLEERKDAVLEKMKQELEDRLQSDAEMVEQERERLQLDYEKSRQRLQNQYDEEVKKKAALIRADLQGKKTILIQRLAKSAIQQSIENKLSTAEQEFTSALPALALEPVVDVAEDIAVKRKQIDARVAEQLKMEEESAMDAIRTKMKRTKEKAVSAFKSTIAQKIKAVEQSAKSSIEVEDEKAKLLQISQQELKKVEEQMELERQRQELFLRERREAKLRTRKAHANELAADEVLLGKVQTEEELEEKKQEMKQKLEKQLQEEEDNEVELYRQFLERQKAELLERRKQELKAQYEAEMTPSILKGDATSLNESAGSSLAGIRKKALDLQTKLQEAASDKIAMVKNLLTDKGKEHFEAVSKLQALLLDGEASLRKAGIELSDTAKSITENNLEAIREQLAQVVGSGMDPAAMVAELIRIVDLILAEFLGTMKTGISERKDVYQSHITKQQESANRIIESVLRQIFSPHVPEQANVESLVSKCKDRFTTTTTEEMEMSVEVLKKKVDQTMKKRKEKIVSDANHKVASALHADALLWQKKAQYLTKVLNAYSSPEEALFGLIQEKVSLSKDLLRDRLSKIADRDTYESVIEAEVRELNILRTVLEETPKDWIRSIYDQYIDVMASYEEQLRKDLAQGTLTDAQSMDPASLKEYVLSQYDAVFEKERELEVRRGQEVIEQDMEKSKVDRAVEIANQILADYLNSRKRKDDSSLEPNETGAQKQVEQEYADKMKRAEMERDSRLGGASTEAERDEIMKDYEEQLRKLEEGREKERDLQLQLVQDKVRARKERSGAKSSAAKISVVSSNQDVAAKLEADLKKHLSSVEKDLQEKYAAEFEKKKAKLEKELEKQKQEKLAALEETPAGNAAKDALDPLASLSPERLQEVKNSLLEQLQSESDRKLQQQIKDLEAQLANKSQELERGLAEKSLLELKIEKMKLDVVDEIDRDIASKIAEAQTATRADIDSKKNLLKEKLKESMGTASEDEKRRLLEQFASEMLECEKAAHAQMLRQKELLESKREHRIKMKAAKLKAQLEAESSEAETDPDQVNAEKQRIGEQLLEQIQASIQSKHELLDEHIQDNMANVQGTVEELVSSLGGESLEQIQGKLQERTTAGLHQLKDKILSEIGDSVDLENIAHSLDEMLTQAKHSEELLELQKKAMNAMAGLSNQSSDPVAAGAEKVMNELRAQKEAELAEWSEKQRKKIEAQLVMIEGQIAEKLAMKARAEERVKLLQAEEHEYQQQMQQLKTRLDQDKEQKLAIANATKEAALKEASTEEERNRIMLEHEQNVRMLEEAEVHERRKHEKLLEERRNARLKAKMDKVGIQTVVESDALDDSLAQDKVGAEDTKQQLRAKIEEDIRRQEEEEIEKYKATLQEQKARKLELKKKLGNKAEDRKSPLKPTSMIKAETIPHIVLTVAEAEVEAELMEKEAQYRESLREEMEKRKAIAEADLEDRSALHRKLEGDYLRIEKEMESEMRESEKGIRELVQKTKEERIEQLKTELAMELNSMSNQEDRDQILAMFQQQVNQIEKEADTEKLRQTQLMKERIEEKKRKRAMQMMKEVTQKVATSEGIDAATTAIAAVGAKLLGPGTGDAGSQVMSIAEQLREVLAKEIDSSETQNPHLLAMQNLLNTIPSLLGVPGNRISQEILGSEHTQEYLALKDEQDRIRLEMKQRHEKERRQLEHDLEDEARLQEEEMKRLMEEKKLKLKQEKAARLAAEIAAEGLSKDEADKLLEGQKAAMEEMEAQIEAEKNRQSIAMKAKLAERKQKRLAEQVKKQEMEKIKETSAHQQETAEIQTRMIKDQEKAIISHLTETVSSDKIPEAVEIVLQKRHARELQEQASQHMLERQLRSQEFISLVQQEQIEEQNQLVQAYEAKLRSLTQDDDRDAGSIDAKRIDMEEEHERKMRSLNEKHAQQVAQRRVEMLRDLEGKQSKDRFNLRERQIREYQDMMASVGLNFESLSHGMDAPEQAAAATRAAELVRQKKEQAERELQELENLRLEQEEEKRRRIAEMEAEKLKHEEQKRAMIQQEMKKYEQELEAERKAEEEKMADALKKRREEILKENRQRQEKELQMSMSLSEDQKSALMEKHKQEVENLTSSLDVERNRQSNMLADRIARKKEGRKKIRTKEIESEISQDMQKQTNSQNNAILELEQKFARAVENKLSSPNVSGTGLMRPSSAGAGRASFLKEKPEKLLRPTSAKQSMKDVRAALGDESIRSFPSLKRPDSAPSKEVSPSNALEMTIVQHLLDKLERIERVLQSQKKTAVASANQLGGFAKKIGNQQSQPSSEFAYHDAIDSQWQNEGELIPLEPMNMKATHFITYQFLSHVASNVGSQLGLGNVHVLAARNLPPNNYSKNAFRNSYYYDFQSKSLFIREQRLESVGNIMLVMVHAFAHIKVRDMTDDTSPEFLREFYRLVGMLGEKLFFARLKGSSENSMVEKGPASQSAVQTVFQRPVSEIDQSSLVSDVLNIRAGIIAQPEPDQEYEKMAAYISKTESFLPEGSLSKYLKSLEHSVRSRVGDSQADHDFIETRLRKIADVERNVQEYVHKDRIQQSEEKTISSYKDILIKQIEEFESRIDQLQATYTENAKKASSLKLSIRHKEQDYAKNLSLYQRMVQNSEEAIQQSKVVEQLSQELSSLKSRQDYVQSELSKANLSLVKAKALVQEKKAALEKLQAGRR
eukprot:TRINITY_DN3836_c0_g1_i5.p1 TRINITY_DN3836_c0_g1~~TRINITY_DN3836_c0_g1_i5.p1  ORF type:complete len:3983 (+),score=991.38 TRINITY_DN3836_c0_g1_i5:103-11949(+)